METRQAYPTWRARQVRKARRNAVLRGWCEAAMLLAAAALLLFALYGR